MNPLVFSALEEVNLIFILMMSSTVMVDIVLSGDTFSLVRIRVKFEAVTSFTICPCNVNKKHGLRTSLQHEADEQ